jgi:hypothetical protein
MSRSRSALATLVVACAGTVTIIAAQQRTTIPPKPRPTTTTRIVPGNTIRMDDDFEYALLDYGFGTVTTYDVEGHPSGPFQTGLWLKFSVTNISAHLLAMPRHLSSIRTRDNWGNEYSADSFIVAILPFRTGKSGRHKPGDRSLELRIVKAAELVNDIREMRVYLDLWGNGPTTHFFVLTDPMQRKHDLSRETPDTDPAGLNIKNGTEPRARRGR